MFVMTENITKQKCFKCSYEWYPEKPTLPKVCPRCKNYKWQQEKKTVEQPIKNTTTQTEE